MFDLKHCAEAHLAGKPEVHSDFRRLNVLHTFLNVISYHHILQTATVVPMSEIAIRDDTDARLHPTNSTVVKESIQLLIVAYLLRPKKWQNFHGNAERCPNSPALLF